MENYLGGKRAEIPKEICAVAFVGTLFWPIGTAIFGPTSLGCAIAGENRVN